MRVVATPILSETISTTKEPEPVKEIVPEEKDVVLEPEIVEEPTQTMAVATINTGTTNKAKTGVLAGIGAMIGSVMGI